MKKFALTLAAMSFAALLIVPVSALNLSAQDAMSGQSGAGSPDKSEAMAKLQQMSAALQLTPAQKQQMLPILMDEAPKLKALKSNTSLPPLQKAMQMRQIGQDTDAKVKPILNPQQYQKWEQMRTQEREQMIQKMKSH